jgi:hypothetical protein
MFQDAVFVMRIALREIGVVPAHTASFSSTDFAESPSDEEATIGDKMKRAFQRFCRCSSAKAAALAMRFKVLPDDPLSLGQECLQHHEATHRQASSSVPCLLVRIEHNGPLGLESDERDREMDSAIILQNYAWAQMAAASSLGAATLGAGCEEHHEQRRVSACRLNAYKLLRLCQDILTSRYEALVDREEHAVDIYSFQKFVYVASVATNSLCMVMLWWRRWSCPSLSSPLFFGGANDSGTDTPFTECEIRNCENNLKHLQRELYLQQQFFLKSNSCHPQAAAAA